MAAGYGDQCIALAGLFQAVEQMRHSARSGEPGDRAALVPVLEAVLRIDAPSAAQVYGGIANLAPGLTLLAAHLSRELDATRMEQARYAASLMYLERRLAANAHAAGRLTAGLQLLALERGQREVDDAWMLERLADLYVQHVSPLGPRIMVSGEPVHLKTEVNAARIRSLLLAGLRAAVLWRQCGGRRWKLALFRGALRAATLTLLDEARGSGSE